MGNSLNPVVPVRTIAPYIGGKRVLAGRIVERINAVQHSAYIEPFVGMGGVFFRRTHRPRSEVINDISSEITTLFRILQRHFQQFLDVLKWQIASRAEFDRLIRVDPTTLTDLERAARFLYLQRMRFGGVVQGKAMGVDPHAGARFNLSKLVPLLEDVHDRLAPVVIERLRYDVLISRYDRPGALFYLDPPYWDSEDVYGAGIFSKADYELLRGILAGLKGRFILSLNDRPEVREIFGAFDIEEVDVNYRASGRVTPARELIISGP
ncbi:MAG: DNA methyltransferase [Sphingomonas sanxanigenens]|uniref:site-specific DNA-methyltransferase (adenine-specific) n=1 Tax=Sphingomonas sanxanigenens TaxID=397260 RepID=A0A2W5BZW5_9SPHN|nr:MAG: DNA methyltransferase [Sphingomonas sanxanigenens]